MLTETRVGRNNIRTSQKQVQATNRTLFCGELLSGIIRSDGRHITMHGGTAIIAADSIARAFDPQEDSTKLFAEVLKTKRANACGRSKLKCGFHLEGFPSNSMPSKVFLGKGLPPANPQKERLMVSCHRQHRQPQGQMRTPFIASKKLALDEIIFGKNRSKLPIEPFFAESFCRA